MVVWVMMILNLLFKGVGGGGGGGMVELGRSPEVKM